MKSITRGLVAAWPMIEQAGPMVYDYVGQNHGTFQSGTYPPQWKASGFPATVNIQGQNGTDPFYGISIANPAITAWPISISYWARMTAAGATYCHFGIYTTGGLWIAGGISNLDSGEYLTGINNIGVVQTDYEHGAVAHVVQVYTSGSAVKVYINGKEKTYTGTGDYFFSRTTSYLGKRAAASPYPQYGEIGNFLLWNRALSAGEVALLYTQPYCYLRPKKSGVVGLKRTSPFFPDIAPPSSYQYARPISGIADGSWTPSTGVDNYAVLDETPASDTDYSTSGANPVDDMLSLTLTALSQPQAGTQTLRIRARYS